MSFLSKLLGREATVEKSTVDRAHMVEAGGNSSSSTKELYAPKPAYDAELAARAYQQAPIAHAMVKIIADLLSTVPLNVYIRGRSASARSEQKLTGQPYDLLQWVNPRMTPTLLKRYTASWMMLDGNAYWAIENTPEPYTSRCPLSIYPLNNRHLKIVADPDTGVRGYVYEIGTQKIYLDDSRVIHIKNFNPTNHWYGMGSLSPLEFDTQIERYAKRGLSNRFRRGAVIDGVLSAKEDLGPDEIRKLKREFREQYSGIKNSHRILVLDKGMEYNPVDVKDAEAGTVQLLQGPVMDDYAMVFGVPYAVAVGKSEKLSDAEFLMWTKTIMPLGDLIDEMLTKTMAQIISPRLYIKFDYSNVAALRLHDLDRARVEVAHVNTGLRTPNEIRDERKLAPHKVFGAEEEMPFGDAPFPEWKARQAALMAAEAAQNQADLEAQKADPSLSLPGSEGGRDQSAGGEAQMVDQTGTR
jgi:HK97 family phage portal protein